MPAADSRRERLRLDQALVDRGLAPSRTRAQALILAGRVFSRQVRMDKPGTRIEADLPLEVTEGARYVGRGGHKLRGALDAFGLDVAGLDALDVGASTGGFTQVLLEAGADRVIALDVGRGQLDWTLRNDPRVVPLEGINARHLEPDALPFRPGIAVVDVSFISLALVLPAVARCLPAGGVMVALVKPQFEVGRGKVGRGGIVKDPALHREVLERMVGLAARQDWGLQAVAVSAIRGAEGNVEFFLSLAPGRPGLNAEAAGAAVDRALEEARTP